MTKFLIRIINFYQKYLSFDRGVLAILAPGGACKLFPTCSEYTKQAITKFGLIKGLALGTQRLWRCK